jgi:formylglycine-generating enzyme required for sulfatase activity
MPEKSSAHALMPAPFAWVEIPGGRGPMRTYSHAKLTIPHQRYWIARYPVTNAQYALFMEAGGYTVERWWTWQGWEVRQQAGWAEPGFWANPMFGGADHPVVGVSWHEAAAFCLWLSEATGEAIMLPTEAQWQYAAQGDDGRAFAWGNDWDCKRCNNSVDPCRSEHTTPVTAYEGSDKGDSPFDVSDMTGNVWEWCLSDYYDGTNDRESHAANRTLRGGSWNIDGIGTFCVDTRIGYIPDVRASNAGFRIIRA